MNKFELIELAKKLLNEEDLSKHLKEMAILKQEARKMAYRDDESFAESKLTDQFNQYYSELEKKESSLNEAIINEKKAIVEKAKNALNEKNFKKANDEISKAFNDLKALGQTNKEFDDKCYSELKEIREAFNSKRQKYFDDLNEAINKAKEAKQEIVNQAKEVASKTNFKEASKEMDELMNKWKQAGFAGKENDEALWKEFSQARKEFFNKKEKYFEELNKEFEKKALLKEELIKKAKMLLANSEFSNEEIEKVKELRNNWKEIGFAGKDKEDALWEAFNQTITKYFQEMKFYKK